MKITCPSCAAEYNVPSALAPGRIVRCAKCGTEWAPVPPTAIEAPPPPIPLPPPEPELEPSALPEPLARLAPIGPEPPARHLPLLLAWLGSGLVIVAALVAAFVLRGPIMQAWPPSQRVYGVLGLRAATSPNVHGNVVE